MRYVLGPSFARVRPAQPAAPSPEGKADPSIEHVGSDGVVSRFKVPGYDLAKTNRLMEVRLYLVPPGDPALPADGPGYVASKFPFGHADVSGLQAGGIVPITEPTVDDLTSHAQYVLGLEG